MHLVEVFVFLSHLEVIIHYEACTEIEFVHDAMFSTTNI